MTKHDGIIEAADVTTSDVEKKEFALEIIKSSNEVVVSFAKLMTATSISAVGVVLTLAKLVEFGSTASGGAAVTLGLTCGGFLLASLLFAFAVRGQTLAVSPHDYGDVVEQFLHAAHRRQRIINWGLAIMAVATIVSIYLIISAMVDSQAQEA